MRQLLTILMLMFSLVVVAQNDETKTKALANQYYQNGDYEKAAELFEELWDKKPDDYYYYSSLYRSLLSLKDYDALEKVVKKQIKKNKDDLRYQVDLGYLYMQSGQVKDGEEIYTDAINSLQPQDYSIRTLANNFTMYRQDDWVIATYEKGNELMGSETQYAFELGTAYLQKGSNKAAIENFLDYLNDYPGYVQRVKNQLQSAADQKVVFDELETQLYGRVQRQPQMDVYPEMLIWLFVQRKDFESAFIQVIALDKRKEEDGLRVIELSRKAVTEGYYDDAIYGYEYVLKKGEKTPWYITARSELLNTRKQKITNTIGYTTEDIQNLKNDYLAFLEQYGYSSSNAQMIRELAQLEAFYIRDLDEAISLLEELVNKPNLPKSVKNQSKLDLGDFYLLKGEVWESTLLYSQVDKEEKDSPLGEEARFRNARLAYFKGEFEWAQAQLKVLKASTTELVANDALDLSIFIMDNLGLDTTAAPMQLFSRAELLMFQNRNDEALIALDSVKTLYPGHALTDDIYFAEANIAIDNQQYQTAANKLEMVINGYGEDLLGDNAIYLLAQLYETQLDRPADAAELYKTIMFDYKDSVLIVKARKRFLELSKQGYGTDDLF